MTQFEIKVWQGQKLDGPLALDTETNLAPFHTRNHRVITTQVYDGKDTVYFIQKKDLKNFVFLHSRNKIIGQNIVFDVQVLSHEVGWEPIFRLYDRNLIYDTKLMYQLYKLATVGDVPHKGSSLANLVKEFFGVTLNKDMEIRGGFEQFANIPIMEIPKEFLEYAALDAYWTYKVWEALTDLIKPLDTLGTDLSLHIQTKGDLVLDQLYKNGVGIDLEYKSQVEIDLHSQLSDIKTRLAFWGIVKGQPGIKDRYKAAIELLGLQNEVPKTDTGLYSTSEQEIKHLKHIEFIRDFLDFTSMEKTLSYLVNINEPVIHPRYTTLMNTGRTSANAGEGGLPIHQMPRAGGVREIIVPKNKDNVFIDVDYSAIEMSGLSQVLLELYGQSTMAEIINKNADLHINTAMSVYNKPFEQVTKEERQFCYSADTELLTKDGWVRIDKLHNTKIEIMQYNPYTKRLSFTTPKAWTTKQNFKLVNFKTKCEDTMVSEEHRMLAVTNTGKILDINTKEYEDLKTCNASVHAGYFNNLGVYSDIQTRVAVMVQADGSFSRNQVRLGFSKQRKIERCKYILDQANIEYKISVDNPPNNKQVINFIFDRSKFPVALNQDKSFLNYMLYDHNAFLDEISKWDGTLAKENTVIVTTSCKSDAETIQIIATLNGKKCILKIYKNKYYSVSFSLSTWKNNELLKLTNKKTTHIHKRQLVYCPTVEHGFLVTRRNNKVVFHGNCKIPNFAFPTNMSPNTFIDYCRQYDVDMTIDRAGDVKAAWLSAYPELNQFFKEPYEHVDGYDYEGRKLFKHTTLTGRVRAKCTYTAWLNTHFQGICADGLKLALYNLFKAGYHIVTEIHDQTVIECNKDIAEQELPKIQKIMIDSMRTIIKDVLVKTEGEIKHRLTK